MSNTSVTMSQPLFFICLWSGDIFSDKKWTEF